MGLEQAVAGSHDQHRTAKRELPKSQLAASCGDTRMPDEDSKAAGSIGIPGLYVTGDPGAVDEAAKTGNISTRIGLGWAKSLSFGTGQCPVMKYHKQLMNAILYDRVQLEKWCNVTMINLDEAPQGYKDFDKGVAKKFVIDPHGSVSV